MKKMIRKIAAMGAAAMMMTSISAMGASAYSNIQEYGAYCTAYKTSSSSVYASTSTMDGSNKTVGVNITLYYTRSGNTLNTGSGNSYPRAVSTTCSTPSGGTFKSAAITHKLNNYIVYTGSVL